MNPTPDQMRILAQMAVKAKQNAYVPYVDFKVGAAILVEDGRIFTGCNVQNLSFGANVCAEHTAVLKAVSEGARTICAAAVSGPLRDEVTTPCGICRQVIREFAASPDIPILVQNDDGTRQICYTLGELLPHAFDRLEEKGETV